MKIPFTQQELFTLLELTKERLRLYQQSKVSFTVESIVSQQHLQSIILKLMDEVSIVTEGKTP